MRDSGGGSHDFTRVGPQGERNRVEQGFKMWSVVTLKGFKSVSL